MQELDNSELPDIQRILLSGGYFPHYAMIRGNSSSSTSSRHNRLRLVKNVENRLPHKFITYVRDIVLNTAPKELLKLSAPWEPPLLYFANNTVYKRSYEPNTNSLRENFSLGMANEVPKKELEQLTEQLIKLAQELAINGVVIKTQ